jgi:hypothetical protein
MSDMEQLKENLAIFDKADPLTETEGTLLKKVSQIITERVPCTNCRYCIEACPKNLDIPLLLTMYNEAGFDIAWMLRSALEALKDEEKPNACIYCGKCNPLCPQNIDIPTSLKKFSELIYINTP